MTRTKAVLAAVAFAALTTAKVQAESEAEKDAKMCQDITGVDTALGNFDNLSKDSTVADAKMAEQRVSDAVDKLGHSAKKARPEQYKALEAARKDFKKSVESAPKDATLGQVQANIQTNRDRLKTAYMDLKSSVTCP
jgi:hypothetical protein